MQRFKLDSSLRAPTIRDQMTHQGFAPPKQLAYYQNRLNELNYLLVGELIKPEWFAEAARELEARLQPKRTIEGVCGAWHVYERGQYVGQCKKRADAELLANQV